MSNTQVAIGAIRQLALAAEANKKLRAENESLKSQIAAIREPLSDEEIVKATKTATANLLNRDGSTSRRICNELHQVILARIEGE